MIKINLLDSVTDRPKGIIDVEKEVARPRTQTALWAGVTGFLLLCAVGFNYWSTSRQLSTAQNELAEQQRIAAQMVQIKKEKEELEQKVQAIEARIDAIQRLRASQRGPVAVLEEMRDRINTLPGLYLKSVEQKGETLTIEGFSPNEDTVTRFGRSLEFSSGLFTSLSIETRKKPATVTTSATPGAAPTEPETVEFTIRCNYNPPGAKAGEGDASGGAAKAATNVPTSAPATPPPPAANQPR